MRSTLSLRSFPNVAVETGSSVRLIDDGSLSSLQGRSSSASFLNAPFLRATGGVTSLALCPQSVSQTSQRFRSSEKQATCEGCFACQSVCSVISHHSGVFRAVYPQEVWKVDVDHQHIPLWTSHSTFCCKLIDIVLWG